MPDPKWDGFVTVFTDASYCPHTGAAGWAAWMKHQGETKRFSGVPKSSVVNASHAEFIAAAYGISLAVKTFPNADRVHLVTDLLRLVEIMRKYVRAKPGYESAIDRFIHSCVEPRNIKVTCKHVKAHVAQGARRNYVNNWCDQEARKRMRKMRNDIKEART